MSLHVKIRDLSRSYYQVFPFLSCKSISLDRQSLGVRFQTPNFFSTIAIVSLNILIAFWTIAIENLNQQSIISTIAINIFNHQSKNSTIAIDFWFISVHYFGGLAWGLIPLKQKSLLVTGKWLEKKAPDTNLKLSCSGSEIEQITSQKLLGVKLDKHLSFTEHIDDICKKVSQRIVVLKKIKRNLPLAECKLYFNALIKPEENVNCVSKLQKRAARVILDADISERSELLFRQLDWLPLKEELSFKRSSLIFRRIKDENACPGYITELLTRNSDRHIRNSRYGKYNLECPSYNKETERGRTFQASGTKPWNSIPLGIRKKDSIGSFRYSVKKKNLAKNS